jgi:hypothetical protein
MTRKLEKLLNHVRKCGYGTFYNEWFEAVQVKASTIIVDSLKDEIEAAGWKVWKKDVPELRQYPVCKDEMSGKDRFAFIMVS